MKTRSFWSVLKRRSSLNWHQIIRSAVNTNQARYGLLLMTGFLGIFYVLQMNITATKGYGIRELEQQKTALQKEYRQLELEAMELQSVDRLMAQMSDIRLVEARPDSYMKTSVTTVASR